ncbi:DUF2064 domain-containing protein [Curtobacterium sp. MCBD17_019]|uniref:TIGR04282 family arsenosugar biosynthesis glycosyltransferase n=1 Tax=Curtobacterium sp. MCBD17_019 TaxID=2175669 RepID=UPI000DA85A34|nr:DUF2064 domain-containing protein [Curtobacterium sp. MCBD17_019]PZE73877.1 glycosyltransferase [Curtobacterium sp. MCBD17_019]
MTTVVLICKECVPGRVKTRLTPALSPVEAARVAAASLDDTIAAVLAMPAERRVLLFDGEHVPAAAAPFDVLHQVRGDLDERLAAMFDTVEGPTLLVGMDTPQLTSAHVAPVFVRGTDGQEGADHDAWFGPAADGGFWGLWLREPRGDLVRGVPMSRDDTGAVQLDRLRAAGLRVGLLDELLDVDTIADADAVATLAPESRFAAALATVCEDDPDAGRDLEEARR